MICIKSIFGLSIGKSTLAQTPGKRPKKLLLEEKLRKFLILHYVLIVWQTPYQKHLGIFLDAWLTFEECLKASTIKINKIRVLLRKLQNILPRPVLLTIYKDFVTPHLDYGEVIYHEAYIETFHKKLESIQYNA